MAEGIFIFGLVDKDTIIALYQSIIAGTYVENEGKTTISYTSDSISETFSMDKRPNEILDECAYFLRKYFPNEIDQKVTQTGPVYSRY